jgi:hypothetical protein
MQIAFSFKAPIRCPLSLAMIYDAVGPFESINGYGLFAVMTTERPEIILEGSEDGRIWKPYTFKYKPGDLAAPPHWSAPYQPRLDWQMWFAALGSCQENPWFLSLAVALLRDNHAVLGLMGSNPFPGKPPRFLRARLFDYRFTTAQEKNQSGAWWVREEKGLYLPVISLKGKH